MSASGWRTAIIIASLCVSLAATMLAGSAVTGGILLFGLFAVGGWVSQFVFRRLATHGEIRRDLEDRVRNPPS